METAVVGTTVYSAYSWVVDRDEVISEFMGLLDAVGSKGDVGRDFGGGGDGGVVGPCGGVEGEVCAKLWGGLAKWWC